MLLSQYGTAISAAIGSNDVKAAASALYWGCLKSELDDIRIVQDQRRKDVGFLPGDAKVAMELMQRWPNDSNVVSGGCTALSNIVRNHGRPGAVATVMVGAIEAVEDALLAHEGDETVQRNGIHVLKLVALKSGEEGVAVQGPDGKSYVNAEKAAVAMTIGTVESMRRKWADHPEVIVHADELIDIMETVEEFKISSPK